MVAIIRRTPGREPYFRPFDMLDEFETVARGMLDGSKVAPKAGPVYDTDIYQEKDDLVIRAEMPGIDKKTVEVSLHEGALTIKAEKRPDELPEGTTWYKTECKYGPYTRTFELPFEVDAGKITATLDGGLLEIRLPKAEEAKPRHIDIAVK